MSVTGATKEVAQPERQAWSGRQRLALVVLLLVFFMVIVIEWWRRQPVGLRLPISSTAESAAHSTTELPRPGRFELNHASAEALAALPGIGPKLAQRIVAYRELHGPFRHVEELRHVPGIGPKTFEKIREFLYVENGNSPAQTAKSHDVSITDDALLTVPQHQRLPSQLSLKPVHYVTPPPRTQVSDQEAIAQQKVLQQKAPPRRKEPPGQPIDINSASIEDLQRLPGIGPVLAGRIVAEREENGPFRSLKELRRVRGIGPRTLEKLRPYVTFESANSTFAKNSD